MGGPGAAHFATGRKSDKLNGVVPGKRFCYTTVCYTVTLTNSSSKHATNVMRWGKLKTNLDLWLRGENRKISGLQHFCPGRDDLHVYKQLFFRLLNMDRLKWFADVFSSTLLCVAKAVVYLLARFACRCMETCSDVSIRDYCIIPLGWVTFCTHPEIIPVGQFFRRWIKSINQA